MPSIDPQPPTVLTQPGEKGFQIDSSPQDNAPETPSNQQNNISFESPPPMYEERVCDDDALICDIGLETIDFSTKTIRHSFIRKVYAILTCQLLVTVGVVILFMYHEATREFVELHRLILIISAIKILIAIMISIYFLKKVRHEYPLNYIFLVMLTLSFSLCAGIISSLYSLDVVLMALGTTWVVCFSLTIFACQTKWNFNILTGLLFIFLTGGLMFAVYFLLFERFSLSSVGYLTLVAIIHAMILVCDTQLIVGGKNNLAISPEEYIFAAAILYMDIIFFFLYILRSFRR